jgi:hypothetical protein
VNLSAELKTFPRIFLFGIFRKSIAGYQYPVPSIDFASLSRLSLNPDYFYEFLSGNDHRLRMRYLLYPYPVHLFIILSNISVRTGEPHRLVLVNGINNRNLIGGMLYQLTTADSKIDFCNRVQPS